MKDFINELPVKDTAPATELVAICYCHFLSGKIMYMNHIELTNDTAFKWAAEQMFPKLKPSTISRIVDKITAEELTVEKYRYLRQKRNEAIEKYDELEKSIHELIKTHKSITKKGGK